MRPRFDDLYFRFATEEYTNDPDVISNNFIHLTNFSINKESGNFGNNSNPEEPEVKGHKIYLIFHSDFRDPNGHCQVYGNTLDQGELTLTQFGKKVGISRKID